ncbi:FecR family protein [Aquimarina sp. 2201CG5-10]|uniref:FecR family protein n=1 Tax=Aquimarina callyspongiae TaxID=3098150 RepID=UPI002AB595E7|nr:FecR family protein [Aquimarina sp. 2201CG5-10]MDY8134384.1 FecR family protein [Aquimarina sp. 2201CG5-10]
MTTSKSKNYLVTIAKIAVVFIIIIGSYFGFSHNNGNTTIETIVGQMSTIELPDESIVQLNALSSIKYPEKNWKENRKIKLKGEAYFKVAKGKKFDVETSLGTISVLGTIFNVKERDNYLEVTCYHGMVSLTVNEEQIFLRAGDAVEIANEKIINKKVGALEPNWIHNRSLFINTPYSKVIQEFEWQYGVTINTKNIDDTKFFTGNFAHSDLKNALRSITLPMHIKYTIQDNTIVLMNK